MGLGIDIKLLVICPDIRLPETLVGIFELDWRIYGIVAARQVGIHMGCYMTLQVGERSLDVAIVLIRLVHGISELNHLQVISTQRKNADSKENARHNEEIPGANPAQTRPQMVQLSFFHTVNDYRLPPALLWTNTAFKVRLMNMHIFFSGIGGTGIGPLALIAHQAGYTVSGSDKQDSQYIHYLQEHGISDIHIGQDEEQIRAVHDKQPIDWFVYSSAVAIEQPDAPELRFCRDKGIKTTKRDELLSSIITEKRLKLIAIAGTHGKTTTTAMAIWLASRLSLPVSYSVGGKISFGEMGHFEPGSQYFIYEADEFDRNFLAFHPFVSIITGIDWDHHDIYPTREDYQAAFGRFISQSNHVILWKDDAEKVKLEKTERHALLEESDPLISRIFLPGIVNRQDAWQVAQAFAYVTGTAVDDLIPHLEAFPGVSRRFEQLVPNLFTDYAHTPPKIRGTLETAEEVAAGRVVVVYEGLHNTRQHFIKDELKSLFNSVKHLYIVPSYLAREDKNLPLLAPEDLKDLLSDAAQAKTTPAALDLDLKKAIQSHLADDDLVVCISAGGGGSLDEWLRREFVVGV